MLLFLLKANIALTLFYLAYRFGLRRLTFYTLNRAFLLLAIICAAVCPFINPETIFRHNRPLTGAAIAYVIDFNDLRQPATPWINVVLIYLFWAGVIVMALRMLLQLSSLWALHRTTSKDKLFDQQVRVTDKSLQPFSFLHNIYINPAIHSPAELSAIMRHEQVHVRQWHSLDVLLGEINKIFYWFNPGAWLISIAIRENLEFITDRYMLRQGADIKAYQYSLLKVSGIPYATAIANNFNFSHLKQRIMMMNKQRSSKYNLVRYFVLGSIMLIVLVSLNYTRAAITVTVKKVLRADTTVTPPPPPPAEPQEPLAQVVPDGKEAPPPTSPLAPPAPESPQGRLAPIVRVDVKTPPPPPPPNPAPSPAPLPQPVGAPAPVPPPPPPPPPVPDSNHTMVFRTVSDHGPVKLNGHPIVYVNNVYKGRTMPDDSRDVDNIQSVFVWKGDSVPAEYGEEARKNGVMFIYTKDYDGPQDPGKMTLKADVKKMEGTRIVVESKDGKN
ncbi:M56 family metallopeptidase [Chitinophaga sp.]|uniref:M56 family metallopeptidase n=1 Tax=Chitinophaga sp. TaxID=1869181 RepID=UPI0031E0E39C